MCNKQQVNFKSPVVCLHSDCVIILFWWTHNWNIFKNIRMSLKTMSQIETSLRRIFQWQSSRLGSAETIDSKVDAKRHIQTKIFDLQIGNNSLLKNKMLNNNTQTYQTTGDAIKYNYGRQQVEYWLNQNVQAAKFFLFKSRKKRLTVQPVLRHSLLHLLQQQQCKQRKNLQTQQPELATKQNIHPLLPNHSFRNNRRCNISITYFDTYSNHVKPLHKNFTIFR